MIDWYALPEFKPKFNERVLVVYSGGIFIGQLIQEDGNGLKFYIGESVIILEGEGEGMTYNASHWAYLPEPPKNKLDV